MTEFLIPIQAVDRPRSGLLCDGIDDNINLLPAASASYTVEIKIRDDGKYDVNHGIFNRSANGGRFYLSANDQVFRIRLRKSDGSYGTYSLSNGLFGLRGQVKHLAVTYDLATDTLNGYLNGVLAVTNVGVGGIFSWSGSVELGLGAAGFDNFIGLIYDFRLWSIVRNQSDIENNMNRRLAGNEIGLLAYLPMDEASGGIAYDRTVNMKHGTITGALWSYAIPAKGLAVA